MKLERPFLDTLRWIAASLVALGHALGIVLSTTTPTSPVAQKAMWYVADLRHGCVIVFFVLSGYLVGGGVLARIKQFDIRTYAVARFSRIYIVLIPAIVLTCALDGTAFLIDRNNPVYTSAWPSGVLGQIPLFDRYSIQNAVATFLSLENVVGIPIGSAGPLWSLGYEWMFYFSFPALMLLSHKKPAIYIQLFTISAVIIALVIAGRAYSGAFFAIWVAGAYANKCIGSRLSSRGFSLVCGGLAVAAFFASPLIDQRIADVVLGLTFAGYLSHFDPERERGLNKEIDQRLASFSYSFYVVHLPIMVFVAFLANRTGLLPINGLAFGTIAIVLVLTMMTLSAAAAYVFGMAFEARTDVLRRALSSAFIRAPSTALRGEEKA